MNFDIIILGAGCAGLSLINYLLDSSLKNKKILLIDEEDTNRKMKTWCYWAPEPLSIHPKSFTIRSWNSFTIMNNDQKLSFALDNLKYYRIRAEDFYNEIWGKIYKSQSITYVRDRVENIAQGEEKVEVIAKHTGSYYAPKIFTSFSIGEKRPSHKSIRYFWAGR
jgi:lycopene beta-cyclase